MTSFQTRQPDFELFCELVQGVNWDASPGLPLANSYPTNRDLFQPFLGVPDRDRCRMVFELVVEQWKSLSDDVSLHPIRLFVKPEPHTLKKRDEGRWRLIFSVSIVDNLLAAMVFHDHKKRFIDSAVESPSMVGWSPLQGGFRTLAGLFPSGASCADKSSWDWSVQGWEVEDYLAILDGLAFNGLSPREKRLIRSHFGPLTLDLGRVKIEKKIFGITPSGTFFTTLLNTTLQYYIHCLASFSEGREPKGPFRCLGDDTIQQFEDRSYWDRWESFGHTIKEIDNTGPGEKFVFAGFAISSLSALPAFTPKHAFRLQHLPESLEEEDYSLLDSYQHIYASDPVRRDALRRRLLGTPWFRTAYQLVNWFNAWE